MPKEHLSPLHAHTHMYIITHTFTQIKSNKYKDTKYAIVKNCCLKTKVILNLWIIYIWNVPLNIFGRRLTMGYWNHGKRGRQTALGRPLLVSRPQALFRSSHLSVPGGRALLSLCLWQGWRWWVCISLAHLFVTGFTDPKLASKFSILLPHTLECLDKQKKVRWLKRWRFKSPSQMIWVTLQIHLLKGEPPHTSRHTQDFSTSRHTQD